MSTSLKTNAKSLIVIDSRVTDWQSLIGNSIIYALKKGILASMNTRANYQIAYELMSALGLAPQRTRYALISTQLRDKTSIKNTNINGRGKHNDIYK